MSDISHLEPRPVSLIALNGFELLSDGELRKFCHAQIVVIAQKYATHAQGWI